MIRQKAVFLFEKYFTGNTMDYRQVFGIIAPILADSAFIVMMSLLNTAMISSSGVAAVSAVSMVDSLNIFIVNVFIALATGGTVIVAQYKGSGNDQMVSRSASQAITLVTLAAIAVSAVFIIFHNATLTLLFGQAEPDVFANARIYLIGSCLTFPFLAVYQAVTGVLRGVGETKPCLVLSIIMNFTCFLLNVLFITILDLDVVGLVISLLLARMLGMGTALIYLLKYNHTLCVKIRDTLHIDFSICKKIMYIGIPFAAEQLFFNGGKLLTQTFIVMFGTLALTTNAISSSLSMLFQVGSSSLSVAIVTVVGQCIGRNDIQDARKFIKSFMGLSVILFILAAALILPLFPLIVQLFSPPEEIIPDIFDLTLLIAVAQPVLWTVSFIIPAALRAAGDSKYTSVTSLLTMWLVRVVLGYVLGVMLEFGLMGVWAAMVIEWGVRGVLFAWRFKGDKWYRHRLI